MDEGHSGLTEKDLAARKLEKDSEKYKGFGEAFSRQLAAANASLAEREHLKRVPESIFVRDILPATSGELGEVDMSWWRLQFGSATIGFLVVDDADQTKVLFEHPPLIKSITSTTGGEKTRPVGDIIADFRNRLHINPAQSGDSFVGEMRGMFESSNFIEFVEDTAFMERICRFYGKTILSTVRKEFREIVDAAIAGIEEIHGPLIKDREKPKPGETTSVESTTKQESVNAYDDDGETDQIDFD